MVIELEDKVALAILREVQAAGLLEGEFPVNSDDICEEAAYWIEQAEKEFVENPQVRKDPLVVAILNYSPNGVPVIEEPREVVFKRGIFELEGNLPVPKDIQDDPTEIPLDYTEIGDKQLRRLHGEYNAYLSRARWLLAMSVNEAADFAHLRDNAYRKAYKKGNSYLQSLGERPTKDLIESHIREDSEFIRLDLEARKAQEKVTLYKELVNIYSGTIDRLSREWTMRTTEYERSN